MCPCYVPAVCLSDCMSVSVCICMCVCVCVCVFVCENTVIGHAIKVH